MTIGDCFIAICKLAALFMSVYFVVDFFYNGPTMIKSLKRLIRDICWRTKVAIKDWRELLFGKEDEDNGCKNM